MRGPRVSLGKDVLWTNTSDVTGVACNRDEKSIG